MAFLKRIEIPIAMYAIVSLIIVLNYFTGMAEVLATDIMGWAVLLSLLALMLGYSSLIKFHSNKIIKRKDGWQYSIILFVCFVVSFIAMYTDKTVYAYIFNNITTPVMISIKSYLSFHIFTVIYRGAQTKHKSGYLAMIVLTITLIAQAPIGRYLIPGITPIVNWIRDVPNNGAMRAVTIGLALGLITLYLRTLLGYERAYLGQIGQLGKEESD